MRGTMPAAHMTSMNDGPILRVPAGTPTGGEFATRTRPDAGVVLQPAAHRDDSGHQVQGETMADEHGNTVAREGWDRCWCGCKYWENDRCIDCDTHVSKTVTED